MTTLAWQKSTYCGEGNSCVEIATDGGNAYLRESEDPVVTVATSPERVGALLTAVKYGRFDRTLR
ncbi:DUF397 domain-containing protein [Streptomyces sp. JJ38]|uniref:DUF397 domain-containing protein n=1 Tax=Streptomyces sp. JJ38 TaxID=2738128 RepID=UPI001C57260A|nr:DUF397 domain-containing protein [Streptomyces sp. JJ38]MBW1597440.1 DUF397 domain-containing protein [Streptomyces sp. JJ38]